MTSVNHFENSVSKFWYPNVSVTKAWIVCINVYSLRLIQRTSDPFKFNFALNNGTCRVPR